jgi:hypothetical protein
MATNHLPDSILDLAFIALILNAACGLFLLLRDLTRLRGWIRRMAIALCLALAVLIAAQLATHYYFAFAEGETAANLGVLLTYFLLMALVLSGGPTAWRLNRIVGLIGIGIPALLFLLSPELLFFGSIGIFGFPSAFAGRISQNTSYLIAIDHTLYGNTPYYRYKIFRNPRWLPELRKQVATGPIYGCGMPALAVGVSPGPDETKWEIWCRQTEATFLTAEISPANLGAELTTKAQK